MTHETKTTGQPIGWDAIEFAEPIGEIGESPNKTIEEWEELDRLALLGFARRVLATCRTLPDGGLMYTGKAWTHSVWAWGRFLDTDGLSLDAFKARLVQAMQARLLDLVRCDLVEAYDKHVVKTSAIDHMGSILNVVRF